ncbi:MULTISPECIES: helix-turn-helix domain-containing protein [Streptomyces]|uniref:helix-turn-helix domain-containing protein n=1 Tax=Streptomyces TaxID=1883 RepID=UPI001164EA2B|nr:MULTISPECIES: helix-turn-helix domain-containing protein [Streptomyces]MCX4423247.1 helix-turn-helix domain-containing protein [Streptomyces mirabilis]QDN88587.1 helix-turn-helix domain-containing protein [Streptomyces sp. RLB3-6]
MRPALYAVPEALTVPEVMTALRLSRSKVYDLIRSRQLASFTVGRARRISPDSLRAFIQEQIEENAA